jgi:hypothetical protein
MMDGETYLGDGLYASFDGYQIDLRAPRIEGDHKVSLEPAVLRKLLEAVLELPPEAAVRKVMLATLEGKR